MQSLLPVSLLSFFLVGLASPLGAVNRVYPKADAVVPLGPGAAVPSVCVETLKGDRIDLTEVILNHGALIVFYRGGW